MVASRQRIIVQLKKSGEASVADLSRELGLTSVTVRHHLQELRRDGLVDEPTPRRRKGPGRPEMAYHLVAGASSDLPRNYHELCSSIVGQLAGQFPTEILTEVLAGAGQDLGRSARSHRTGRAGTLEAHVEAFLEERGYLPRWVRRGDDRRLHLANCPYHEIAQNTPEMCSFDKALVAGLMGTSVRLEASIAAGAPVCCFQLASEGAIRDSVASPASPV